MRQYDNRDRALQQFLEVLHNPEQSGKWYTAANIPGHCLLLAGKRAQAQDIFYKSCEGLRGLPKSYHKYNSAFWYLQSCF